MPFYLESLDGSQSYCAATFCSHHKLLEDGRIYELKELLPNVYCMGKDNELGFYDWLETTGKPPARKLKAVWYGPKNNNPL